MSGSSKKQSYTSILISTPYKRILEDEATKRRRKKIKKHRKRTLTKKKWGKKSVKEDKNFLSIRVVRGNRRIMSVLYGNI